MKHKKFLTLKAIPVLFSFALFGLLVSCSDDDPSIVEPSETIVDLASANSSLTILTQALTKFPDLVTTLNDANGSFTVFAPTDEAFANLLSTVGQSSLDDIPEGVLRRILEYHVVSGELLSTELTDGANASTVLGENVTVDIDGTAVSINSSNVTTADVDASNGVVHVVDAVLIPGLESSIVNTVVEPAYFNVNFTTLTAAVVQAELLNTLINRDAQFTIFVPNNAAFEAAGITSLEGISTEALANILLYHTLDSEVLSGNLPATGSTISTLGGDFYLSINENGVFINGSTQVIATDIDAENGVVHVIDKTLLAPTSNVVEIAVAQSQAETPEFTQLVAALTAVENDASAANLISVLSGDGPFTVFAPTDAAFAQLYADAGVSNLDELIAAVGIGTLEAVLTYHVINEARVFSTDLPNLKSNTISVIGGSFTLDLSTLTITESDQALNLNVDNDASIVSTDIFGTNGVIHVIDKVILP